MPQIDFIFDRADHEALVQFALDQEGWLVPSNLRSAVPIKITDLFAYRKCLAEQEKLFHVQHADFERTPLQVVPITSGKRSGQFYVLQRNGGPTIDLLGPYEYEEEGTVRVASGFISYYPTFWNSLKEANEHAPAEQKVFFSRMVRRAKKGAYRLSTGKRTYWIGESALRRIRGGVVSLPKHWAITADALRVL